MLMLGVGAEIKINVFFQVQIHASKLMSKLTLDVNRPLDANRTIVKALCLIFQFNFFTKQKQNNYL